jgi:DNA-binding XRE family transcriptional regulator
MNKTCVLIHRGVPVYLYVRGISAQSRYSVLEAGKVVDRRVYLKTRYALFRWPEGRKEICVVAPLRDVRLGRTLSQRDLAERAGVAPKTVVDLELGRNEPRLRTMRLIAQALGVEVAEIDEFRQALEEKAAA